MKRILLIFIALGLLCHPAFANRDSLGLKQVNNKWYILHKVEKGTGLFSIARHYNVTVEDITTANPGSAKGIRTNQVLMIPYDKPVTVKSTVTIQNPVPTTGNGRVAHYYTVDSLPTLYRISLRYKVSVEQLRKWNNLKDDHISKGQKVIVGYTIGAGEKSTVENKPEESKTTVQTAVKSSVKPRGKQDAPIQTASVNKEPAIIDRTVKTSVSANSKGEKTEIKEVQEAVLATTIEDNDLSSTKNLALHRTAAPGTVIKVTNPMNNASVYVKVIGPLTADNGDPKLVMKISRSTADKLGIKDEFFRLNTHYSAEVIKK
jgi:LysM repeat protein